MDIYLLFLKSLRLKHIIYFLDMFKIFITTLYHIFFDYNKLY